MPPTWSIPRSTGRPRRCRWRSTMPASGRRTSTISTRTAPRPRSTTSTRPAPSSACSAMRQQAVDLLDQVDARPLPRGRGRHRSGCRGQGDRRGVRAPDRWASTSPIRNAISTTRRIRGVSARSITPCRIPSPSAASMPCSCSGRRRHRDRFSLPAHGLWALARALRAPRANGSCAAVAKPASASSESA